MTFLKHYFILIVINNSVCNLQC